MKDLSQIFNRQRRQQLGDALLRPFSWAYGAGVWLRNTAFDSHLLKQKRFDVPVVSVGNIAVGGTGKTPHVEYIISALSPYYRIGVLSRGYKRKTHGFIMARDTLTSRDLGDEPYQIFLKFGSTVRLAVCESRRKGIAELLRIAPDINLILLDDAFQHRWVKPKVNIVLIDYNRPPWTDHLLPLGRLREPMKRILDADMVVVTKCPDDIKPIEQKLVKQKLDLFPQTQLFFSNIKYGELQHVFPAEQPVPDLQWLKPTDLVLGLTGIANPRNFVRYLRNSPAQVKVIHYRDHHDYTRDDFRYIMSKLDELQGDRKIIVTTEKDAVRMLNNPYFPLDRRDIIYYVPIQVGFLNNIDSPDFIGDLKRLINRDDSDMAELSGIGDEDSDWNKP